MIQTKNIMPVFMTIEHIAKRQQFGGFSGLKYGRNPEKFLPPPDMLHEPMFGKSVFNTMSTDDVQTFKQDDVERGEFLQHKHNLAGKKQVDEYEDAKQGLAFDPLGDSVYVGENSYDTGKYQGGTRGASGYLNKDAKTRATRGETTTLDNQNPYAHTISNKISIPQ